jgi:hypothetical protein
LLEKNIQSKINRNTQIGTFISEKKKLRIYLLSIVNGTDCFFFIPKLVRAEMRLRNHSKDSKSKNINLD